MDYRSLSLWLETAGSLAPRAALAGDLEVDVAIVGAGLTGLWTAYYLLEADPSLRVGIVEAEIAGFGASGRNGGWCSALFPGSASALSAAHGRPAAIDQYRAMRGSLTEVVRVARAEGIEADIAVGGTVVVARSTPQLERARHEVAESEQFDLGTTWLDAEAASSRLAATSVLGATYTPHCAALHPGKLVRGLASVVEARGVPIYERSPATALEPGRVQTPGGTLRAGTVVRATEAYTARLPGLRRSVVPIYSLIIATEPLPEAVWDEIGLRERETFSDHRHVIVYGQRSADNRMIFGGRGAFYHLGSRITGAYDRVPAVFDALHCALVELFPILSRAAITHRWGGPLGIARDWQASVGLEDGLGWAGGYVGDGVSTTNLAGRTLADLIVGNESELTRLPWVDHRSRQWEPEPLRWLGANAGLAAMNWADASETKHGRPSRVSALVNRALSR